MARVKGFVHGAVLLASSLVLPADAAVHQGVAGAQQPRRYVIFMTSEEVARPRGAAGDVPAAAYGTPASSAAPCQKGQIEFDARYIYTCVATNVWTRTPTASF